MSDEAIDSDDRAAHDAIAQDVACPSCGYNLRGLHGSIVTCPECGTRCDAARLISRRWTKPWHRAPGFNTLLLPVVWLAVVPLLFVLMSIGLNWATDGVTHELHTWIVTIPGVIGNGTLSLIVLGVWLWLMARAWRVFHSMRGVWLALLAHALVAGYLVSIIYGIGLFLGGIFMLDTAPFSGTLMTGGALILLIGGVWLCRRGERFIADQCIRRYLDQQVITPEA